MEYRVGPGVPHWGWGFKFLMLTRTWPSLWPKTQKKYKKRLLNPKHCYSTGTWSSPGSPNLGEEISVLSLARVYCGGLVDYQSYRPIFLVKLENGIPQIERNTYWPFSTLHYGCSQPQACFEGSDIGWLPRRI